MHQTFDMYIFICMYTTNDKDFFVNIEKMYINLKTLFFKVTQSSYINLALTPANGPFSLTFKHKKSL